MSGNQLFDDKDFKQKYKSDMRKLAIQWDNITSVEQIVKVLKAVRWELYMDVNRKDDAAVLKTLIDEGIAKEITNE
jgi:hypothetical protein